MCYFLQKVIAIHCISSLNSFVHVCNKSEFVILKCAKFITIIFNLAFTKKPIERCQFLFSWSFFASMCIKAHYPLPIMHFFICSLKLFCARFDAYVDSIHNDFLFVVVIVVFAIFSVYSAVDIHFWNCVHY